MQPLYSVKAADAADTGLKRDLYISAPDEAQSGGSRYIEIPFRDGRVVSMGDQFGLGRLRAKEVRACADGAREARGT